jgi:hypothetical protein
MTTAIIFMSLLAIAAVTHSAQTKLERHEARKHFED